MYLITGGEEILIAEHKDINDKDQTYTPNPKPKTDDNDMLILYGTALLLAVLLAALVAARRRSLSRNSDNE